MKTKLIVISQEFFEKMEDVFDTATNALLNEGMFENGTYATVAELQDEWNKYKKEARKVEL